MAGISGDVPQVVSIQPISEDGAVLLVKAVREEIDLERGAPAFLIDDAVVLALLRVTAWLPEGFLHAVG